MNLVELFGLRKGVGKRKKRLEKRVGERVRREERKDPLETEQLVACSQARKNHTPMSRSNCFVKNWASLDELLRD